MALFVLCTNCDSQRLVQRLVTRLLQFRETLCGHSISGAQSESPRERFINLCERPAVLPLAISMRFSSETCFQFRRYKNLRGVA